MNIAVIFAGGVGSRMHSGSTPKQFLKLHGKPIIIYTLEHFERHPDIDSIVISCVSDWIDYLENLLEQFNIKKVKKIVPGGKTGQLSIYNGLRAAKELCGDEKSVVLVHDGVRPLIDENLISENIEAVKKCGSSITTAIVKETILVVQSEDASIDYVPERSNSRVAKAPQSFWIDDLLSIHERAISEGKTDFIDCCTMMHHYGVKLHLVDGPYENIKITTPDDFYTMRALLDSQENAQIYMN